jgi:GT2 family glycosyltransferase
MLIMDLSVIIVSYKGYKRLERCLKALDSFMRKDFSMEVIVVNNNPGDTIFTGIEKAYTGIKFIHNTVNGGYSNGCNLGCSNAAGDYFLVLNPDTFVEEQQIGKMLCAAKSNPSYYIISCRQLKENGKDSRAYGKFPWRKSSFKDNSDAGVIFPDWVSGSVMMINRNIYQKLNGFDEDFWMYYEDVDFCHRARNAGGEIAFYNKIIIQHDHGASSRIDLKTTAVTKCEVQISRHYYIHKHERGLRRIGIQVLMLADNLLTGFISGLVGLILFFIPKLFVRFLLFIKLISYYSGSLLRNSWLSPRSVNFGRKKSV